MVTKAKEESKVEEPVEEKVEVSDDELTAKITAIVKDLLGGTTEEVTTETEETETGKPVTARQEEAQTHSIVSELVKQFKAEFEGKPVDKKETKEPETKPGPKAGGLKAWVEKNLWGVE